METPGALILRVETISQVVDLNPHRNDVQKPEISFPIGGLDWWLVVKWSFLPICPPQGFQKPKQNQKPPKNRRIKNTNQKQQRRMIKTGIPGTREKNKKTKE